MHTDFCNTRHVACLLSSRSDGCSLDEHKRNVHEVVDLDHHIKGLFTDSDYRGTTLYKASETFNASLKAIRVDPAVSLVGYGMGYYYRAEISNAETPESARVPESYVFFLAPDATLEKHKSTVRELIDLDKHAEKSSTHQYGLPDYRAVNISDDALEVICRDRAIAQVEYVLKDQAGGNPGMGSDNGELSHPWYEHRAFLRDKDVPEEERLLDVYDVKLEKDYPFEQHKAFLKGTFDLDVHSVDDYRDLPRGLATYTVRDIDKIALPAIRSDEGVFSVTRAVKVPLANGERYRAPLRRVLPASKTVAGSYLVYLRPGWSLERHKKTVSEALDLEKHLDIVWPSDDPMLLGQVVYVTKVVNASALTAIRAETGVEMVECKCAILLSSLWPKGCACVQVTSVSYRPVTFFSLESEA